MALKNFKPTTPSQRGLVLIDRAGLYKGKPVKALTQGLTGKGGRNNHGRTTIWGRGGGTVFGPVVRSHGHDLPKKVRRMALKTALSAKQADGKL
ncbi:MAG: 50S ribosomal protein L4, partial [Minwuiales bacterium]|nr:50S ribosomal protein L4 [Minwuiales bacterium]